MDRKELESLLPWAYTDEQRRAIEAVIEHGSCSSASTAGKGNRKALQSLIQRVRRRAAKRGWAPGHDMDHPAPDGYHVKGVSTYYGPDGEKRGQWVKTQQDDEQRLAALLEALEPLAERVNGKSALVPAPRKHQNMGDLVTVYPLGDPHIGMLAWSKETGDRDFDLSLAQEQMATAVSKAVGLAPPAHTAIILNLGDFFHADNFRNMTPKSGNILDVDGRLPKVMAVGRDIMVGIIEAALGKHQKVLVYNLIGNHDELLSTALSMILASYFRNNPRVEIEERPRMYHFHHFGKVLLGFCHGHTIKAPDLPGLMAVDKAEEWGAAKHRHWYTGHVHHDTLREYPGCIVETARTLAPKDSWHAAQGYRAGNDLKVDVWHKDFGRVLRHTVGIEQILCDPKP